MTKNKYVAYVSTYTMGDNHGIKIYDVDMKNGRLKEKDEVEITNSSYITISHNEKYLYSITDFGVEAYVIEQDGELTCINHAPINGMRGCYLSTDMRTGFCLWQAIMTERSQCSDCVRTVVSARSRRKFTIKAWEALQSVIFVRMSTVSR